MSRWVSPSTDQVYGLQRATQIWGVSRATVCRHRHQPEASERRRRGPLGAMADEELVRAIRRLLQDSSFHGEGYRKLWARLRLASICTSRRRGPAADARAWPVGPSEELCLVLLAFKQTDNQSWIIERHGHKTPAPVRADQIGRLARAA